MSTRNDDPQDKSGGQAGGCEELSADPHGGGGIGGNDRTKIIVITDSGQAIDVNSPMGGTIPGDPHGGGQIGGND